MARLHSISQAYDPAVTPFQLRVYDALRQVPRGRVTTYGLLARRIGCASAQAVGQALRRNPFAPRVPCHRVIAADLSLGGFTGCRADPAIARKRALLAKEGVRFDASGRLLDPRQVYAFRMDLLEQSIDELRRQRPPR